MRKINLLLIATFVILLSGCSGSDTYRGKWFALGPNDEQLEIVFEGQKFTVIEADSEKVYDYTQNSVKMENSAETYGITTGEGKVFRLHFPNDVTKGAFLDENGQILYMISREKGVTYNDVFGL